MNIKELARLIVRLLGIYFIFQGVIFGGLRLLSALSYFIERDSSIAMAFLGFGVPAAVFMIVLGIVILKNSDRISDRLINTSECRTDNVFGDLKVTEESLSVLLYSLVGLCMLIFAVPPAAHDLARWLQIQFWSENSLRNIGHISAPHFETISNLVHHITTIGMSFLVFMKGKSIYMFFETFRGAKAQPVVGDDHTR